VDVVLLAPQIRFAEKEVRKTLQDKVFLMVIASHDFGMMNAEKVMNQIQQGLSKKH